MAAAVSQNIELLVDFFLSDDPALAEPSFIAEGAVEETHDADDVQEEIPEMDLNVWTAKTGRNLRALGDDINKKYYSAHRQSLSQSMKFFFDEQITKAGGTPEEVWPRFRDVMDNAIKETRIDDANKVLAAVLMSIRGLKNLGSGLKTLALRYIGENKLDEDFKKLKLKNYGNTHPNLD